jgi:hypothetical protein
MKTYKLHVSMPSSKFGVDVVADYHSLKNDRLNFYGNERNNSWLLSSYPSQYTIIESIKDEK